jgi:hypothetical protein
MSGKILDSKQFRIWMFSSHLLGVDTVVLTRLEDAPKSPKFTSLMKEVKHFLQKCSIASLANYQITPSCKVKRRRGGGCTIYWETNDDCREESSWNEE